MLNPSRLYIQTKEYYQTTNGFTVFVPASYLDETKIRIAAYRQISELSTIKELKVPGMNGMTASKNSDAIKNLFFVRNLKSASSNLIHSVIIEDSKLMMKRNNE